MSSIGEESLQNYLLKTLSEIKRGPNLPNCATFFLSFSTHLTIYWTFTQKPVRQNSQINQLIIVLKVKLQNFKVFVNYKQNNNTISLK